MSGNSLAVPTPANGPDSPNAGMGITSIVALARRSSAVHQATQRLKKMHAKRLTSAANPAKAAASTAHYRSNEQEAENEPVVNRSSLSYSATSSTEQLPAAHVNGK